MAAFTMRRGYLQVIWLTVIVGMMIAASIEIQLPISVRSYTRDFYNTLENLKPGDNLLILQNTAGSTVPEAEPAFLVVAEYCQKKQIDLLVIPSSSGATVPVTKMWLDKAYGAPFGNSPLYGKQFVMLDYIPNTAAAFRSVAMDLQGFYNKKDALGNPLGELPVVRDIKTGRDIQVVINFYGMGDTPIDLPGVFTILYGSKYLWITTPAGAAMRGIELYQPGGAGVCSGAIFGSLGGAELEVLTKIARGNMSYQVGYFVVGMMTFLLCLASICVALYRKLAKRVGK